MNSTYENSKAQANPSCKLFGSKKEEQLEQRTLVSLYENERSLQADLPWYFSLDTHDEYGNLFPITSSIV